LIEGKKIVSEKRGGASSSPGEKGEKERRPARDDLAGGGGPTGEERPPFLKHSWGGVTLELREFERRVYQCRVRSDSSSGGETERKGGIANGFAEKRNLP